MTQSDEQSTGLLAGMKILVVEDEYFIADDVRRCLAEAGATVIGPKPNLAKATEAIAAGGFDCVVLDLNLDGESGIPLADRLAELQIPFVIATGYDSPAIPERLRSVERCEKPFDPPALVRILDRLNRSRVN